MRRILFFVLFLSLSSAAFAQTDSVRRDLLKTRPLPRSNDHLLLQFGYLTWQNMPDTINTGGIPRTFNIYFLFDFPFKTNPHWSAAIGLGAGSDHMFFDEMHVGITERTPAVRFRDVSDTNHFKKYKLATTYLEAPVELRFSSRPTDSKRSVKFAVGAKVGLLLDAHVKGKTLRNASGNAINDYKMKEYSKQFFNSQRLSTTARIGYGNYSLFASYQVTPLFKEGLGPAVRPLSLGITLSGL